MKMLTRTLSILAAVLFYAYTGYAFQDVPAPVTARLVANTDSIAPGEKYKIGVMFKVDSHWHIYWKNSGDSGLPTKVEFELPEGFEQDHLNWPIPKTFKNAGDITDYGYEDELLLYSVVSSPEDLKPGSEVNIIAKVSWISCKEICIPGKADLTLSLPVKEKSETVNTKLFSEWDNRIPASYDRDDSSFTIFVEKEEKENAGKGIKITLDHNEDISGLEIYPNPVEGVSLNDLQIENRNEKTDITMNMEYLSNQKQEDKSIEILVVYKNQAGERKGIEIPIADNMGK